MALDFADLNGDCLAAFGQALSFTPASSEEAQEFTGILEAGAQLEAAAPGDSSSYARVWLRQGDLNPQPAAGDEISTATTVYKILGPPELDAAGGMRLLLCYDREAD